MKEDIKLYYETKDLLVSKGLPLNYLKGLEEKIVRHLPVDHTTKKGIGDRE